MAASPFRFRPLFDSWSPKTRKLGNFERIIPLFPELLPFLIECSEAAPIPAEFVKGPDRHGGSNLRTQMTWLVRRAGLEPWPRIFRNLRASRQTELEERYPSHVVCGWMGNTEAVARRHYLQITEQHFATATDPKVVQNVCSQDATGDDSSRHAPERSASETPAKQGKPHEKRAQPVKPAEPLTGVDGNRTHLASFQRPHRV